MTDRPILRFPNPQSSVRRRQAPGFPQGPSGPGNTTQRQRFQATFDRLSASFDSADPNFILRQDPAGIAPERALVFVFAGSVQNFSRAAQNIGLEVFTETDLEGTDDYPSGFTPPEGSDTLLCRLYATMPTLDSFRQILSLWNAHQAGREAPLGAAPWWSAFDLLLEIRPWGPEDRLTDGARKTILERLPFEDDAETTIEFEIWPTADANKRAKWSAETERRVAESGGWVLDRSSISEVGFGYEALLAVLPVYAVREMLDNPRDMAGLAALEGVQYILPQTIAQAGPSGPNEETGVSDPQGEFDADAPVRAALFDGTPVAGHTAIDGAVVIEDIHDLVGQSVVNHRVHATAMASLILRGDLEADGTSLTDTRLVCVPLLIDGADGARAPNSRLFVDMLHTTLVELFTAPEPLASDVFVINFSIGIPDMRFAGRISPLARLIDWWAAKEGILFVISAGNIVDPLPVLGITSVAFEDSNEHDRREMVRIALRDKMFDRTLLAPAESFNGLTVGAVSEDLISNAPPLQAGILTLEGDGQVLPQITSALGLGPHRVIKPDLLNTGGCQEYRVRPDGDNISIRPLTSFQRTGLITAAPTGIRETLKSSGTSASAALTTRAILQSAEALVGADGPYEGQELPRRDLALLTRALSVNSARWSEEAIDLYKGEHKRLGTHLHAKAKEEVCRYFGHGVLSSELMQSSPDTGATLVGLGSVRKDQALIFKMPLPPSMSGDRVPRSMRVTLAWFTPVDAARAQYRLAGLEAVAADALDDPEDTRWGLDFKVDGPDTNMVKRGSVWSKRFKNRIQTVPAFDENKELSICVQCRDTSGGGLNPDDDIHFAIAVTLEVETEVQYDIHQEIKEKIRLRVRRGEQD